MHGLSIRFHLETHHPSPQQGLHNLGPVSAVSCHLVSGAKFISLAGGSGGLQRFVLGLGGVENHFLASSEVVLALLEKGRGQMGRRGPAELGLYPVGADDTRERFELEEKEGMKTVQGPRLQLRRLRPTQSFILGV